VSETAVTTLTPLKTPGVEFAEKLLIRSSTAHPER
jgi:hypothetical protein